MGKEYIYTRVLFRCVLVGSLCSIKSVELQAVCVAELMGKNFIYSRLS